MNSITLTTRRWLALAVSAFALGLNLSAADAAKDTPKKGDGDAFEATETIRPKDKEEFPAGARIVRMRPGETVEVFSYEKKGVLATMTLGAFGDKEEEAFFLPVEATGMLQLIVERKRTRRVFFVRANNIGKTVGGVVKYGWLDSAWFDKTSGFRPKDAAHEARIQTAIKAAPVIFVVEHPPAATTTTPNPH